MLAGASGSREQEVAAIFTPNRTRRGKPAETRSKPDPAKPLRSEAQVLRMRETVRGAMRRQTMFSFCRGA